MAYVIWKIFLKQYTRIRKDLPRIIVNPSKAPDVVGGSSGRSGGGSERSSVSSSFGAAGKRCEIVNIYDEDGQPSCSSSLPTSAALCVDIATSENNPQQPIDTNRVVEVRRSKSRVRTYLKKCKDRLTGHHPQDELCTEDCFDNNKNSTSPIRTTITLIPDTCFLVDETKVELPSPPIPSKVTETIRVVDDLEDYHHHHHHQDQDTANNNHREDNWGDDVLLNLSAVVLEEVDLEFDELVDSYLGDVYPLYYEKTRSTLIRQARDVLVCEYRGCMRTFEKKFLRKFAKIAEDLKEKHADGKSIVWPEGWPLATCSGELILQLGAIDEALLRPCDVYICVKPGKNSSVELCAVWRTPAAIGSTVQSRIIDYRNSYISPLSLEMLSDELPQLLQNLLVGVERAIGRISLTDLSFPTGFPAHDISAFDTNLYGIDETTTTNTTSATPKTGATSTPSPSPTPSTITTSSSLSTSTSMNDKNLTSSPKCALKRSELITKNKMLNNKYLLRRLSGKQDNNCNMLLTTTTSTTTPSSCRSLGSNESASSDDNHNNNNSLNHPAPSTATTPTSTSSMPLFCLGNSFPHIDSDEEVNPDEKQQAKEIDNQLPDEIIAPRSIAELPEKLLSSGIHLPGTRDLSGRPIVSVDAECLMNSSLNCYEVATVLLFYSTIPESTTTTASETPPAFTILISIEKSSHLNAIELICNSLKLLTRHFQFSEILAVCIDRSLLLSKLTNRDHDKHSVKLISVDEVTNSIAAEQVPKKCAGLHHHDQKKWREIFTLIDTLQNQCLAAGQRLVTTMGEIRSSDQQGLPTRRQLYAQHRALSRALMDSELHNLRKRAPVTLARLQDLAKKLNYSHSISISNNENSNNINNNNNNNNSSNSSSSYNSSRNSYTKSSVTSSPSKQPNPTITTGGTLTASVSTSTASIATNSATNSNNNNHSSNNIDVAIRLNKVTMLFNEVDRAAKRLEQLTEQRRERLRELTRQRALEDEINEVKSWIQTDGQENLIKFTGLQLDCEVAIKEHEKEFEKYYFISMKHLAKGSDLYDAAVDMEPLKDSATQLKTSLDSFSVKLEQTRERIEDASRLHHLLNLHSKEEDMQHEMQRLSAKLGEPSLVEKCHAVTLKSYSNRVKPKNSNTMMMVTSTPDKMMTNSSSNNDSLCHCWREESSRDEQHGDEDEEEHSKIADSGLGGCDRCEGNPKLARVCSCQSLNEAGQMCDKSDELDDDCYGRNSKQFLDIHSPMEANSHLQCHASNMDLPRIEELSGLDPKVQKRLLLIMREMIGTERDYVRSLYYVIENYVGELLRDNLPQPLRGQRNVIFGNIEKIFEFHQPHFLAELERYECNPLKVGAAFLENESKFYLYALYNKNKPKSDTLMSEYGTTFFKSKQMELNDKMDLASYLLKPVQRMGKYALLLQQLVKACSSVEGSALHEIAADVEELHRAEEMVKFQLRHGNDLLAMDSLRDCDVNVKEQGRLLRQNEFLVWQGRGGKKSLRQVFLFEDLVLFSKARRFPDHKNLDIYIYKNSIKTSDIGLTAHTGDSSTKFEIWFRKRKPEDTWTLQSMSEDIKNAWTEEVSKLLWKQAKRNREIRLAEMSSMGIGSKPCLDIRPSNNQISDRSITINQLGKAPKLRNSFAGSMSENSKAPRRPNSLISESSMSSGTSGSSISNGSGGSNSGKNPVSGLELINETQTLVLSGKVRGNHKRSTTLISQLSMESGIMSDISMTPDNESHEPAWPLMRKPSNTSSSSSSSAHTDFPRRNQELSSPEQDHPYLDSSVTVHL
ncbi:uncharacterized protein LOC129944410 isoform X2 [Eupeodes corollae]|uniref:uncharacterized protein LOC129944410 isoform X2 n=1 Tax=Eupeodes corollae TaxID=290404 RepID=UPI002493CED3|nr:uncharacterized protein LOC129944410 isoform X2 [Eupeodes corollae]